MRLGDLCSEDLLANPCTSPPFLQIPVWGWACSCMPPSLPPLEAGVTANLWSLWKYPIFFQRCHHNDQHHCYYEANPLWRVQGPIILVDLLNVVISLSKSPFNSCRDRLSLGVGCWKFQKFPYLHLQLLVILNCISPMTILRAPTQSFPEKICLVLIVK